MKAKIFILSVFATVLLMSYTNLQNGGSYLEIHYAEVAPIETDDYRISFHDMHSQSTFCLVRMEVTNKTSDWLFMDLSKISFDIGGKVVNLENKKVMIKPLDTKNITVKSPAVEGLPAEKVDITIDGITRMPADGKISLLEEYPIPDTKKEISNADLKIALNSLKKETKLTDVKWDVENTGKLPVLINESKISVTCKGNDQVWPCDAGAADYAILWPGETTTVKAGFSIPGKIVDMQFATMSVKWGETFLTSTENPLKGGSIHLEMDLGKTEAMNK